MDWSGGGGGGGRIAQWLKRRSCDEKVEGSSPRRSEGEFSVLTLISVSVPPRVTAAARKDPGHSAKSTGGRSQQSTF